MRYSAVKLTLTRRHWKILCVTITLAILPMSAIAQDSGQHVADENELLTTLLPDRIALPIGDQGKMLEAVVYSPHNYDPTESYPLLVVLDADPLLGLIKTLNFLWVEEGKAAPVILVGLPFGASAGTIWSNRSYFLLPNPVGVVDYYGNEVPVNSGGGAKDLAKLIQDEVLPDVLERYSVDSERIGLAGFSMGGLFVAWHLVTYPEVFSDYLVIAPPLAPPFVESTFERATKDLQQRGFRQPTRLYIAYAENDLGYVLTGASSWISGWQELEGSNLRFHSDVIKDHRHDAGAIPALIKGYEFLYEQ